MLEERIYWLVWCQVNGVGPILLQRLQQYFGTLAEAWIAPAQEIATVEGFGVRLIEYVEQTRSQLDPEQFFAEHTQNNPCFWTPADPEYPHLLREIPSYPPVLYYRGEVNLSENQGIKPLVAIVGTREPTEYGKRWTRKISRALAQNGFTVVSGMAAGIDTEAHRGCLEAGGRTMAVLGTGVDLIYPPRNQPLYEQILQQGLILSEYPAGTGPNRVNFPQRNRIIAGLSRAVIVMEAPTKSGALITAYQANEFCRDVYALPGSLDNPNALGCLGLLSRGANVILNEGHLLDLLGAIPQLDTPLDSNTVVKTDTEKMTVPSLKATDDKAKQTLRLSTPEHVKPIPELAPDLLKVFQVLTAEPKAFDEIVQHLGMTTAEVSSALLQLELEGLVSQLPGMQYRRC